MNFSLEIGPHTDINTLPKVKDVYITLLPGGNYQETAADISSLKSESNFSLRYFTTDWTSTIATLVLKSSLS